MRSLIGIAAFLMTLPLAGSDKAPGTLEGTLSSVWLRKYSMIVYLEGAEGDSKPSDGKVVIDQKNKMFVPHVLALPKGETITYLNHDDTKHNVYFIQPDGKQVNLGTGMADWSKDHQVDQAGVYVHRCNIHEEMSAYAVVLDSGFYELIEKRASRTPAAFKFEGVPEGDYKLRVWCERFYDQPGNKFNRSWDVSIRAGQVAKVEVKP